MFISCNLLGTLDTAPSLQGEPEESCRVSERVLAYVRACVHVCVLIPVLEEQSNLDLLGESRKPAAGGA